MTAAGLLTVSRAGRQKHYQANRAAPIFPELRQIVLKTSGLRDVLQAALSPLERDIRAAFVFGSIAKGVDTAGSDVALMLISDHLTYAELFSASEAGSTQLARPVNPTIYTSDDFRRRIRERNPFLSKVLEQPKFWVIVGDDELSS